ncbi:glycosyltransferase family 9 protein [Paenimyroides aestuarii]|uniref:Lipopolysaccharide heptosyltransferase family protein n=1 Tax=Paenimyroides aestuarii TaxID=2968490 RepID=A0ABY5NQE7_9FLAO|nr:glycosyltransferase family 9 protein [Paenimyroides aestuarii]UUV20639.1 lipopolysaccharide heptosyltransferase family protein [Paenimyroides aestuarii]
MKKILVIQQKMIGDVLVSSIICENLAIEFPDAQIDYLIYDTTFPVLLNNHSHYNIIHFTSKQRNSKIELLKFASQIRKENYDVVIDSYSKLESWIITGFSGAKTKISFDKKYINAIYTHVVKRHRQPKTNLGLTIEQRLALLKPLGILSPKILKPTLIVSENEKKQTIELLEKHHIDKRKSLGMISLLGSSESKTYPLEYMAKVIDEIVASKPINLLFNYIPNQINEAKKIFNLCKPETQKHIYFDVIGKSLRDFIGLMNECDFIIGNDGGAINMAKALNKPAFTIFSPVIDKLGWNSFEDGTQYISVHLKDFKPNLFENLSAKDIKIKNEQLYLEFEPKLFNPLLMHFLKHNA